jgi:tannase/feruloyl esterase
MRKLTALALVGMCAVGVVSGQTAENGKQACSQIQKLSLAQTEIIQATVVEAGKLVLEQAGKDTIYSTLPAFCRVVAVSRPSSDSNIEIEVWLPVAGWNGKFMGQGNGGFAGSIGYRGLAVAVRSGFASGGTDAGHTGEATDSTWALGHPEKVIDFGYRAVHAMTELSKTVVQAFYSGAAQHSYFTSCSDGGREALMEAQRFPGDYDGILAGAPAYNWTSLVSRGAELARETLSKPESKLPASKVPAISKTVLVACQRDEPGPFLADPRTCKFSPEMMLCKGAENDGCLTQGQVKTVKALYGGSYLRDGKLVYHGLLPGGELGDNGWPGWITGSETEKSAGESYGQGYFRNLVYSNPNWELKSFDLDQDLKAAEEKTGQALNAVNPDLRAFKARGGKLILYHGWNDPAISPLATIDYYNSVVERMGRPETEEFVRLFLVPGLQHCAGGPGLTDFGQFGPAFDPELDNPAHNITFALETWVEKGTAPEQVIARGSFEVQDRKFPFAEPICAYPKAAEYKGSGDQKDAASYACVGK